MNAPKGGGPQAGHLLTAATHCILCNPLCKGVGDRGAVCSVLVQHWRGLSSGFPTTVHNCAAAVLHVVMYCEIIGRFAYTGGKAKDAKRAEAKAKKEVGHTNPTLSPCGQNVCSLLSTATTASHWT